MSSMVGGACLLANIDPIVNYCDGDNSHSNFNGF